MTSDPFPPLSQDKPPSEQPEEEGRYIRIRRSHFYAALMPLAFAAGVAYGYLLWGRQSSDLAEAQGSYSAVAERITVETDDDPALGPANAPITIIEFSDYNCPYCRAWQQQVMGPLLEAYPDQIRFVYRDFPIVGGGAAGLAAAQAANCAGEQQAYWDYHAALFSGSFPLDSSGFRAAAESLGLDAAALVDCVESGRHAEEVNQDLRYAAGLGIRGTPTFFINGIPLVGAQPLERFSEIIDAELQR